MEYPRRRSGFVTGLASFTLACVLSLAGPAQAQWPTSYLSPKILTSGNNIRAGSVLAQADGGVVACYDTGTTAAHRLWAPRFDSAGSTTQPGDGLAPVFTFCETAQLVEPSVPTDAFQIFSQNVSGPLDSYRYYNQYVGLNGKWNFARYHGSWRFQSATHMPSGWNFAAAFDPGLREIGITNGTAYSTTPITIPDAFARNFRLVPVTSSRVLVAYEQFSDQPGTPSKIWSFTSEYYIAMREEAHTAAEPVGPESQSDPALATLTGGNVMLAWIGSKQDDRDLFCKVLDLAGATVAIPRQVLSSVENYVITSSTLGIPVFGAVQRNRAVFPPVDTLLAGLVDPTNGGVLALPLVSGLGIKTKFVQQEADGNVSLGYSIPENGTTLLKVRRISGSSGATLWETTVADLGMASDELIDRYPNTFVSGNSNGVLYLLARHDQPYSVVSNFQIVRLRADGQMGADPLVAPGNVAVSLASPTATHVSWTDTNTAETHYIVARTESDFSGYHILGAVPADVEFFDDTVSPDVQYHYIVATYDAVSGQFVLSEEIPFQFEEL